MGSIQDYAEAHHDFFSTYFKLPFTPRHDTFLEILSRLDPQETEHWFRRRVKDILGFIKENPRVIYAVDSDTFIKKRMKESRSSSRRYFISSVLLPAEEMLYIIRNHWGIETKLHWRLDVVTNEDGACIEEETTVVNVNKLRKFAFNLLMPLKGKKSMESMFRSCANPMNSIKILNKYFCP